MAELTAGTTSSTLARGDESEGLDTRKAARIRARHPVLLASHKNLPANLVSTLLLAVGLTLVLTSSASRTGPLLRTSIELLLALGRVRKAIDFATYCGGAGISSMVGLAVEEHGTGTDAGSS